MEVIEDTEMLKETLLDLQGELQSKTCKGYIE